MKYNLEQHGLGWRMNLLPYLKNSKIDGDVIQFGVWDGFSMQVLGNIYKHIAKLPNFFGFDVFVGMPTEESEPERQMDNPGSFNILTHYGVSNLSDALRMLKFDIETNLNNVTLIPGLVQTTLDETFLQKYNIKQATYVDFDMDIYSPTVYTFDFLIKHKIINSGTIIGFDDWNQNWEPIFTFGKYGENRAFLEICQKYNIQYELLFETENHGQAAFLIL